MPVVNASPAEKKGRVLSAAIARGLQNVTDSIHMSRQVTTAVAREIALATKLHVALLRAGR